MNVPCPPSRHLARHVATRVEPLIHIEGSTGILFDGEKLYVRLIAPCVVSSARRPWLKKVKAA